jgi:hypothetical protein
LIWRQKGRCSARRRLSSVREEFIKTQKLKGAGSGVFSVICGRRSVTGRNPPCEEKRERETSVCVFRQHRRRPQLPRGSHTADDFYVCSESPRNQFNFGPTKARKERVSDFDRPGSCSPVWQRGAQVLTRSQSPSFRCQIFTLLSLILPGDLSSSIAVIAVM